MAFDFEERKRKRCRFENVHFLLIFLFDCLRYQFGYQFRFEHVRRLVPRVLPKRERENGEFLKPERPHYLRSLEALKFLNESAFVF